MHRDHGRLYTIAFGIALAVICSTVLKTIDAQLNYRIGLNKRLDRIRNVLLVLDIHTPPGASSAEIENTYHDQVEEVKDGKGKVILFYRQIDPKTHKVLGYAFPMEGMGLWDKVRGLMAVETDLATVRSVAFYEQQETPGLGGRIAEPEFTDRFHGKKITGPTGAIGLHIVKAGKAKGPNELDGITAATLTCQAVDRFMNAAIQDFVRNVKK